MACCYPTIQIKSPVAQLTHLLSPCAFNERLPRRAALVGSCCRVRTAAALGCRTTEAKESNTPPLPQASSARLVARRSPRTLTRRTAAGRPSTSPRFPFLGSLSPPLPLPLAQHAAPAPLRAVGHRLAWLAVPPVPASPSAAPQSPRPKWRKRLPPAPKGKSPFRSPP